MSAAIRELWRRGATEVATRVPWATRTAAAAIALCLANVGTAAAKPPPPHKGFQMYLVPLSGFSIPAGEATGASGDALHTRYGPQWVPFAGGIGVKLRTDLYVGAYLYTTVGPAGDDPYVRQQCEDNTADFDNDIKCSSKTLGWGVEARYFFTPGERVAPSLDFGLGPTQAAEHLEDNQGYSETVSLTGMDLVRVGPGVDFRFSRGFGLGFFANLAIGRYHRTQTVIENTETFDDTVSQPTLHAWFSSGLRLVIMP